MFACTFPSLSYLFFCIFHLKHLFLHLPPSLEHFLLCVFLVCPSLLSCVASGPHLALTHTHTRWVPHTHTHTNTHLYVSSFTQSLRDTHTPIKGCSPSHTHTHKIGRAHV